MFYYLDTSSQIRRIVKNTGLVDNNYKTSERSSDNTLRDFIDGELYKRILNSRIGSAVKRKESFTMTFNPNGISLSESSTLSIWPCFGAINEIIPQEKFCVENIILYGKKICKLQQLLHIFYKLGICVGYKKPDFNVFLEPLVPELKKLEQDICLEPDIPKYISLFLVAGIFDKPAKAAVLYMKANNGFGGCTKCLQLGETLKGIDYISN